LLSARKSRPGISKVYLFAVLEYWIVDPVKNTLEVYLLRRSEYELVATYDETQDVRSPSLPGLTFRAARVFAE